MKNNWQVTLFLVLALFLLPACTDNAKIISETVDSISTMHNDMNYAIEDIGSSATAIGEESLDSIASVDRAKEKLLVLSDKSGIVKSKSDEIQVKISSLKQLELSEKQSLFVEKLSKSYGQYGLYSDSVGQLSSKMGDFLNWYSHFLQMSNYLTEIDKNEGMISTYAQSQDWTKVKAIVVESKSKIKLAKQELDEAEKIISFPFVIKFKAMFSHYNGYVSSLSSLANNIEKKDVNKALEDVNTATRYYNAAQEVAPLENEPTEQIGKWYNENINNAKNKIEEYSTEAKRNYDDAFVGYNSPN